LLGDYHESIREATQITLLFLLDKFMNEGDILLTDEQEEMLRLLRGNISVGWGNKMTTELRETASLEASLI